MQRHRQFRAMFWVLIGSAAISSLVWADEATSKASSLRGRLPVYYARVVTPDQRQKIYSIQGAYSERIVALEQQLADLIKQRDAEVAAVLTDEQRTRVEQFAAEAQAKRDAAKGNSASSADNAPSATGPAAEPSAGN